MCPSAEGSVRDEDVSLGGRSLDLHADDMRHYVGIGTAREIDPRIMPDVSEGATDTEEYISLLQPFGLKGSRSTVMKRRPT